MRTTRSGSGWRRALRTVCGVTLAVSALVPTLAWGDPVITTLPTVTVRVSLRHATAPHAPALALDPATGLLVPVHPHVAARATHRRWPPLRLDPTTGLMRMASDHAPRRADPTTTRLDPATGLMVPVLFSTDAPTP